MPPFVEVAIRSNSKCLSSIRIYQARVTGREVSRETATMSKGFDLEEQEDQDEE